MKYTSLFAIALVAILSGCSSRHAHVFVNSFSPSIHRQQFITNSGTGTYFYRKVKKADSPAVLFIIGGSGHSSAIYTLAFYSKALKQVNADVYTLQKQYVRGRETGLRKPKHAFISQYYFERMVADQELFIKTILERPENKGRKVILLGVSEGATIAAKVSADIPRINCLAIIGSGGMSQADELKLLYPAQQPQLDSLYSYIKEDPESTDSMAIGYSYKYWSHILFVDPMQYFLKLNMPVLLAIGGEDKSVPVASARYLQSQFNTYGKTNLDYVEYAGCDHTLTDHKGKSHLTDFFSRLNSLSRK